jgi:pimeloyl-ACP methyl ester carboxylesterase
MLLVSRRASHCFALCSLLLVGTFGVGCRGQPEPPPSAPLAVTTDPLPDPAHPPRLEPVLVPSGGVLMNGVLYIAAGSGSHPTVLLLHGFPGNEQNLDLAQAIRRAGWNVLTLHYRGSWGSPGAFSFSNAIEDSRAALAFLRDPANLARYQIDPKRLAVIGHSMGGFLAATVGVGDPALVGVGMIAPWNIGSEGAAGANSSASERAKEVEDMRPDTVALAGTTPAELIDEAVRHAADWDFLTYAPALRTRTLLLVSADDDALSDIDRAFGDTLRAANANRLTATHVATDHAFSGRRIELASIVVTWLASL